MRPEFHHLTLRSSEFSFVGLRLTGERWTTLRHMKSNLSVAVDLIVAIALFSLGVGVCQGVGAPSWPLGLAGMPCLAYLGWRRWLSWRFVLGFVFVFTVSGIAFAIFMPRDMQQYSGGLLVLLLPAFIGPARAATEGASNKPTRSNSP